MVRLIALIVAIVIAIILFFALGPPARGDDVTVINPTTEPVQVDSETPINVEPGGTVVTFQQPSQWAYDMRYVIPSVLAVLALYISWKSGKTQTEDKKDTDARLDETNRRMDPPTR